MNRRLLPYFQLVRLPNVFTALADILLGALATGALLQTDEALVWLRFPLLLLASACLYCSGMVWNDYFDIKQDQRERPFRPLPSGKVKRSTAFALAAFLMVMGVAASALGDWYGSEDGLSFRGLSLGLALLLCLAILLYDSGLKRTWAGPLGMGACRFLNVLLGLSVAPIWPGRWAVLLALVVGIYIVGVTWFARTEARRSEQWQLGFAAGVMALALVLALAVMMPVASKSAIRLDEDTGLPASFQVWLGQLLFPYLIVGFAAYVGFPVGRAIRLPSPMHVQKAVKQCVLGLVALDAILATVFVGPLALLLLVLLVPAGYLGRWIYST
jgi:4-hydroxybenzoate polyprenyltransferase